MESKRVFFVAHIYIYIHTLIVRFPVNKMDDHSLDNDFLTMAHVNFEVAETIFVTLCSTTSDGQKTRTYHTWLYHGNLRVPPLCHPPRK